MAKVIAVMNEKGGVGKSATATTLALKCYTNVVTVVANKI